MTAESYTPDEKDLAILRILQKDAKLSIRDIANRINLSPTPTHERIKRMEKLGIIRELSQRNCDIIVVSQDTTAEEILLMDPDGIMLSNGPGDPEDVPHALDMIRGLLGKVPIFGICLGHQLIGLACGAKTFKLKFGHRGGNHPVLDLEKNTVAITSQNHGFAVVREELEKHPDLEITHVHLNDGTVAGMRMKSKNCFSVQYHPEASPGPHDSSYLFDDFITNIKKSTLQEV